MMQKRPTKQKTSLMSKLQITT